MEVTSGDIGEASSPGDVPMDTAANSPEGIAMSLFQDQDMEVTAPSPQVQPLVSQGDSQQDPLEQIMKSIQVVEATNQQQQQLQSQPAPQQQLQQPQPQPQPITQDNLLKFGQDVNMGGIALNCGTVDNNQAVQNILGQLLNPVTQQTQNGTHHLIQAADGSLQLINMNGSILQNLPTASNNITLTTDTNSAPVTTPFVLQQANPPPGTTQPVLLNPNTFLLNPGATVPPQTIILNPFTVPNQPNPAAANNTTIFVAPANLASGNTTTFLTNLNAAQLQPTIDASVGGSNNAATVLLTAPANVGGGDSNTILLQPETKTNVPVPPTSVGASVGASGPAEVKPFNSGLRRSLGKSSSQKTVQELLMEDEQKRVQVDSKSLDLVKTRDTLALRLKLRRPRNELVEQGIIPSTAFKSSPAFHEQLQKLERAKVGDHLQKKMRMRPDKAQLVHHHILEDTNLDPIVNARQQMLKRARLEQDLDIKIKNRPGPLELIEGNILKPESEVEQLVKDGSLRFFKTSATDPDSLFAFYDTTDGSDEALSPPQPDTSTSDTQPSSVTSIPSPSDSLFLSDKVKPFANAQTSPNKIISSTVPSLTIKQEQGVTSPPAAGHSPFSVLSGSSSCKNSNSSRNQRKKQAKRSKPKEIKFHEYKPPNEQGSKAGNQAPLGNPYNLLLMQQQLYLQLQLLQQQQQQRALPAEQPNLATSSSSSSSTTVVTPSTKLPSPTVQQTASASASPSQSDIKSTTTNSSTNSSSGSSISNSNTTSSTSSTATTTATSTTATRTFSLANIEDMKVSELKAELKNRGLHVSGTKPQLVQRLRNAELTAQSGSAANSPDVTSSSATKVTSSTDVHIDSLSDCNSNRQSLASPPVSPPDMKGTEPMSPSSPQFESPTFQPMKTTSISSPVSNASSVSFQSLPQSQEQRKVEEMTMSPPASAGSLQLKSPPPSVASTIGDSSNTSLEMLDLTDYCVRDAKTSSQLLKQQQQKIEELQRALELSQMQLMQQQFVSNRVYNPPPPPPPPPPPAMNSAMTNRVHTSPPSNEFQQFFPDLKLSSPPNPKPNSFQGQDFAHTINQHPKIFSFASPPANGQPFQFTKSHSDLRAVHSSNGIITPKSASMPSSPTDEAILELGSGLARSITNPNFMAPPPNYEEAVRQTTERKAQMMGSPPPTQPMTSVANTSRSSMSPNNLSFDDLLEVLVGHGYPATSSGIQKDSRQVVQNTPSMKSPPPPVTTAYSNNTTSAAAIQKSLPDLTASPGPMEVDHSDLSVFNHVVSDNKSKNRYSIPSMQIDSTDPDNNLLSLTLESGSPAENAFPGALSVENDLNWLDLVLPSTSASTGGHNTMGGNAESSMTGSFVKDPFPLNLSELTDINSSSSEFHHLDGDMWDNIQVTE